MAPVAQPKVRSRKDGSAIPLDETDKKLLNLMQGSFDCARGRSRTSRSSPALPEAEVMQRVQRLLDGRIIREITPIFDTRALGYSSMLVAAKVDPEYPHRAAQFINTHPGVTHNYLRDHDFNLWFTLATEPGSTLGLDGTIDVIKAKTGAHSIRQLPTLKLFKIRMDLEMEKGTDALVGDRRARRAASSSTRSSCPRRTSRRSAPPRARCRSSPSPTRPRPSGSACRRSEVLRRLESLRERNALRRVAAILFHRRAGFSANGMGVWAVPDEQILDTGRRMAAFRGISHCYQRPTYPDWPYSVFTMAHGRSKEECDAILDSIAEQEGISERATLYSSTEFKKIRMLYFTDAFKDWERENSR